MADSKGGTGQETPTPAAGGKTTEGGATGTGETNTPPPAAAKTDDKGAKADKGGKDDKGGTPAAESKAPEKYDLTIPKGAEAYVDQADLEAAAQLAKKNGWTNEEAQSYLTETADGVTTTLEQLRKVTEADPEYGGDNLEASRQHVARVVDRLRPDDHPRTAAFKRLLVKTGVGNHVEMFAFLADIGKMLREDQPPGQGKAGASAKRRPEDVLYGGKTST